MDSNKSEQQENEPETNLERRRALITAGYAVPAVLAVALSRQVHATYAGGNGGNGGGGNGGGGNGGGDNGINGDNGNGIDNGETIDDLL